MYSTAKNVQIVIALLKAHGISDLVISPGGTNAPFIRGVQDDPFFKCHSVVDERSALYYAIGIYLVTGNPVAMCCTSAQATRNYIPGLTEAYYKHVPILAITFSKHPQYIGQDYMQAPNQTSLPVDCVRKSFALPYVSNEHDRLHCERLANEAMLEIVHNVPAPVQLNIPMLDNELGVDDTQLLPKVKVIRRYKRLDKNICAFLKDKRVLIVVGENRGVDIDTTALLDFAKANEVVIYANQLSNISNDYVVYGNRLMSWTSQQVFDEIYCPDILITIGGQTGDYPLYHKLAEANRPYEHWRISPGGEIVDTYDHLTKVFECDYDEFFRCAIGGTGDGSYLAVWKEAVKAQRLDVELPLSNAYLAQQLYQIIPNGSIVNFAILNSLRVWNFFPLQNQCRCFSNVAAFGIDGCMSTFIGQSTQTDSLCFLIIGDLSFFYDMNSLGLRQIGRNVRILLVNNSGGMEFKYGGTTESRKRIDQYIAAAGHFKNAEGWAITCGFEYFRIKTKNEFNAIKEKLVLPSDKSMVVEVFVDERDENGSLNILRQFNFHDTRTFMDKVVGRLKREINKII